jgi:hypothetical protein
MKMVILILALTLMAFMFLVIVTIGLIHRLRSEKPAEALTFDWLEESLADHIVVPLPDNRAHWRQRIEQRRAFRLYLAALRRDYVRITFLVKRLLVSSDRDRPELVKALLKQTVLFHVGLTLIEFRLALNVLGIRTEKAKELVELTCSLVSNVREMAATLTFKTICQEASI